MVNHAMNHANPLRVMETDVSSPAFDVIYGMLRCKFELFIISAVGLAIDQTIVDIHSGLIWFIG